MDKTIVHVVIDWMQENSGLINTLKSEWLMSDAEVIEEILKLGARNEIAILDQMSIDRLANERGE